jgi:DNA polymerase
MNARLEYLDALGVDVWLERGRQPDPVPVATTATPPVARHEPAAPPPDPSEAPDVSALDFDALAAQVAGCRLCALCDSRTQTVFGVGDRSARWMIVGEAPGSEEDRRGEPFVGRAGQLLDAMLLAAGFKRSDVFIANVLKCRPPNNRDPSSSEAAACLPYLKRQIELVGPDLILAVGRVAAQRLLDTTEPLGKIRGRVHRFGANVPVVVTYHPAYLLRSPSQKRKAYEDLVFAHQVARGEV